ncbi:MAG: glycosyltransferase [Muribaculaceae bacterium]|nr:glycosyltransferase [Muribaculaceae bacterium]
MILSIIVPVYNVEKYLRKCLDSCLRQDIPTTDYEIICVNDGSPDNCGQILEEYVAKYPNIQVLTQTNQGLSMARNNGVSIAKGDYVWFIDSDDWIEENCLGGIIDDFDKKSDIVQLNYRMVYESYKSYVDIFDPNLSDGIESGKNVILKGGLPSAAQFSIYRRAFLISNDLKFAKGRLHEDIEFKPRATFLAKTICWHKPVVYNYLQRGEGSIMSSFKLKNGVDIVYAIDSLDSFINSLQEDDKYIKALCSFAGKYFNSAMTVYDSLNDADKKSLELTFAMSPFIFRRMKQSNNRKYRLQAFIFSLDFHLGNLIRKLAGKL